MLIKTIVKEHFTKTANSVAQRKRSARMNRLGSTAEVTCETAQTVGLHVQDSFVVVFVKNETGGLRKKYVHKVEDNNASLVLSRGNQTQRSRSGRSEHSFQQFASSDHGYGTCTSCFFIDKRVLVGSETKSRRSKNRGQNNQTTVPHNVKMWATSTCLTGGLQCLVATAQCCSVESTGTT